MEATAQSIRLDSNVMSILHSRAEHQQQTVEDYTNQLLRIILDVSCTTPPAQHEAKRNASIDRLCGVLHDDDIPYETTRQEIMEERYGLL